MKEYEVDVQGVTLRMQLSEADAKRFGGSEIVEVAEAAEVAEEPEEVETKQVAPANKGRAAANR